MPTAESRDLRAADLRERAALVRRDGWSPYASTWSGGEVLGVRAVLGEPGAVDAAVELWAPTLWGTDAAEVDGRSGYRATRWWFASVTNPPQPELTETEQARYRAARAASADLRAAVDAGDEEGRRAAARQLLQTLSTMNPDETRDKLHVPDDAGEYHDGLIRIMCRVPPNWGRWISCDRGWYPIIVELDQRLAAIDPDYVVHQCKEKHSGLRYYVRTELGDDVRDQMWARIREAEAQAEITCELCGEPGVRHVSGRGWLKTLCSECATAQGYERIGELVNDLAPEHRGLWKVTDYAGVESMWDMSHGEVSIVGGERCRGAEVLALPSVLRSWRIRLADGSEVESEMVAAIERVG